MTPRQRDQRVAKLVAELREWSKDPSNTVRLRDNSEARIRADLSQADVVASARAAAARLSTLAVWHACTGVRAVVDGDTRGWLGVERSRIYRLTSLMVITRAYDRDARPAGAKSSGFTAQLPALLLAHSLVVEDDDGARELLDQMLAAQTSGVFGSMDVWPAARFILEMCSRLLGCRTEPIGQLGFPDEYATLLRSTNREEVAQAIIGSCDYHLEQAVASAKITQYTTPPYELFPVELLLIRRTRSDVANVEHPLLAALPPAPLARDPAVASQLEGDELLSGIKARAVDAGLWPKVRST